MPIFRKGSKAAQPHLSYHPNDLLAKIIANAWADDHFRAALISVEKKRNKTVKNPNSATKAILQQAGIFIDNPVVLDEATFNEGYTMGSDDEVVFVLPDPPKSDLTALSRESLLETARVRMAHTACGI